MTRCEYLWNSRNLCVVWTSWKHFMGDFLKTVEMAGKNTRLLAEQRTYLTFYFDLKENKRYFYDESDISLEWSES